MADLLSIEDYQEAFYIIKNSLDKIAYLQHRYLMRDKSIEKFRLEFLHGLKIILDQNLAPTFRSTIEALLLENVKKSYFYPERENLVCILDDYAVLTESDKKTLLAELIAKKDSYPDQHALIMTLIQLSVPLGELANILTSEIDPELYAVS